MIEDAPRHDEGQNQRIHAHQVLAVRLHKDGGLVVLEIRFMELIKDIGILGAKIQITSGEKKR